MILYRTIRVATHAQHLKLERLYICGQVYNTILDVIYKLVSPPGIFNSGLIIVLTWFLTMRHSQVPWYIYMWFPYIAILFTVVLFALCYDGILAIRASKKVLSILRSNEKQYFLRLPAEDRKAMMRRAKALRPAFFSVGNFTDFNVDVPIGVWNQIVNQLVFLLTL